MAYTRIHPIKTTLHKSVAYICDPGKTEENLLVDAFECFPETAAYNFRQALSKTEQCNKNLAYHLIQSFAPGEVSHEEAHRIGIELADRLLRGNYSYVIATHTDRQHPHNHIIFCAADNTKEHKKFNDNRKAYYHIRQLSDDLCREHGLSVIKPSGRKGKSYAEWKAENEGNSWKAQLKKDIDETIALVNDYHDFIEEMRKKGYAIKGADFGENALKYISFKAPGQQKFIRGSLRSLGKGYTKDEIKDRIENKEKYRQDTLKEIKPHQQDIQKRSALKNKLIDTSGDKFRSSPSLTKWAERQNLKTVASNYADAGSLSALKGKIEEKENEASAARTELIAVEKQLKVLKELQYNLNTYKDNLPFQQKYRKSKDPDRYMRMHETQLILFDGAKRKLHEMGITPKMSELNKVNSDVEALEMKKAELEKKYRSTSKEAKNLRQKQENITQYLGVEKDTLISEKHKGFTFKIKNRS